jgi:hypothetical protein
MSETTKQYDQWKVTLGEDDYHAENIGPDGTRQFYAMQKGPYGNPIIIAEPDRAFPAPKDVNYVDANGDPTEPEENIAGIVCAGGPRFSLSSAQAPEFEQDPDGTLRIKDGIEETRWHLSTLFRKDANRIIGYDGFYSKDKPENVRILELGDLGPLFETLT